MAEVNLERMEKYISLGYSKDEAYDKVKAEAEATIEETKNKDTKEAEIEAMKAEIEALKAEKEKAKEPVKEEPKIEETKIGTNSIKGNDESYIDVLKKFC